MKDATPTPRVSIDAHVHEAYARFIKAHNQAAQSSGPYEDVSGTYRYVSVEKVNPPRANVQMRPCAGGPLVEISNPDCPDAEPVLMSYKRFRECLDAGLFRTEEEHKNNAAGHELHVLLGRARVRDHYTFCSKIVGHDVDSLAALTGEERNRVRNELYAWT